MNTNGTTQVDADCNGWTLPAGGTMASGNPWFVADWDFSRLPGTSSCGNSRGVLRLALNARETLWRPSRGASVSDTHPG